MPAILDEPLSLSNQDKRGWTARAPVTLGTGPQPRGYGRVLQAIRNSLGFKQYEMFDHICDRQVDFPLPEEVERLFKTSKVSPDLERQTRHRRTQMVSAWERSVTDVPFAIQFRYGDIMDTRNGMLHVVSGFYSDCRTICDDQTSSKTARDLLKDLKRRLNGFRALTTLLESYVQDLSLGKGSDLRKCLANKNAVPNDETAHYHATLIIKLLHAYSDGKPG